MFPCPRSRLRILYREAGAAVPSRVSLLILHTQAESAAYLRDSPRFPRRRLYIYTVNRHRVSPELIRSRNCVPMALTAESPPGQIQYMIVLKCCLFRFAPLLFNTCYIYICKTIGKWLGLLRTGGDFFTSVPLGAFPSRRYDTRVSAPRFSLR